MLPDIMGPIIKGFDDNALKKGMKRIPWSPEDTKWYLHEIDRQAWEARLAKLPPGMGEKLKKMMGY